MGGCGKGINGSGLTLEFGELYVAEKLAEAENDAKDPNMKRYSHDEIWDEIMGHRNV